MSHFKTSKSLTKGNDELLFENFVRKQIRKILQTNAFVFSIFLFDWKKPIIK
jgi:hypothetical protein